MKKHIITVTAIICMVALLALASYAGSLEGNESKLVSALVLVLCIPYILLFIAIERVNKKEERTRQRSDRIASARRTNASAYCRRHNADLKP